MISSILSLVLLVANWIFGILKVKQETRDRFAAWLKAANNERKDKRDLNKEVEDQKKNLEEIK